MNGSKPGLSSQKLGYIRSLASHFSDPSKLKGVNLSVLSDHELHEKLGSVKGLGPWSVEMFQMFKLRKQDVFSVGDQAIQRGMGLILFQDEGKFDVNKKGKKARDDLIAAAEHFKPYRSLLCFMCYRVYDEHKKRKTK